MWEAQNRRCTNNRNLENYNKMENNFCVQLYRKNSITVKIMSDYVLW